MEQFPKKYQQVGLDKNVQISDFSQTVSEIRAIPHTESNAVDRLFLSFLILLQSSIHFKKKWTS